MEIKLTADKKLLEALDKLADALKAAFEPQVSIQELPNLLATYETEPAQPAQPAQPAALDPLTALPVVDKEEPAQPEKPAEAPSKPAQSVPNREDVQRVAVTKIQSKLGAKVKALIEKHGGTRVSDVPEENLAAFMAELEALA